jgi:hypothetical protein
MKIAIKDHEHRPTPSELALEFCNYHSDEQAEFFDQIAKYSVPWNGNLCMKLQYVSKSEKMTICTRNIMLRIGECVYHQEVNE